MRAWLGGLVGLLVVAGLATPADAVIPKAAVMYGDSLTWESRNVIAERLTAKGWTPRVHSFGLTAPCDWLAWLPADLETYHPRVVGILTAGNTNGLYTTCMHEVEWSDAYFAKYQADISAFAAVVKASGAKVVFFAAPPFADPHRDTAVRQINAYAKTLPGVGYSNAVRTALSVRDKYAQTKPCAALDGTNCVLGTQIPIRTLPGNPDYGLHLCPVGIGPAGICSTYSSGAVRFGKAVATGLMNPPKPIVP